MCRRPPWSLPLHLISGTHSMTLQNTQLLARLILANNPGGIAVKHKGFRSYSLVRDIHKGNLLPQWPWSRVSLASLIVQNCVLHLWKNQSLTKEMIHAQEVGLVKQKGGMAIKAINRVLSRITAYQWVLLVTVQIECESWWYHYEITAY